jgi:hypothetical protein
MTSIVSSHKNSNKDFDEITKRSFIRTFSRFLNDDIQNNFDHFLKEKKFSSEEAASIKSVRYSNSIKLGVVYFHGYSFPWEPKYKLEDIRGAIRGERLENIPKNSYISKAFNINKGVYNLEKFERFLFQRGFKKCEKSQEFYMKALIDKKEDEFVNIFLDQDMKVKHITQFKDRSFNIDYIRDRNSSSYRTTGTYLDLFDIRFQLNSSIMLPVEKSIRNLIKPPFNEPINEIKLLERSKDNKFLTTYANLKFPIDYLRENKGDLYSVSLSRVKDLNPMEFIRYFTIQIDTLTEYVKEKINKRNYKKNNQENQDLNEEPNEEVDKNQKNKTKELSTTFKRILIAYSTVNCNFDMNRWLIDLEEWFNILKSENKTIEPIESIFNSLGGFLFDQIIAFSNELSSIYKSEGSNQKKRENSKLFLGFVGHSGIDGDLKYLSTVKHLYQDELVDYQQVALIKRIMYSSKHNHLSVFDLNLNTIDSLTAEVLNKQYYSMLSILLPNADLSHHGELTQLIKTKSGPSKIALKKLQEAYLTLIDESQRNNYILQMKTLKKYKNDNK